MSEGPQERTATFGEIFAIREYRALFVSETMSVLGDMLARVAVTFLVWQQTSDTLLTAATFAVSYAPYLLGAPILSALVERYPYRRTMMISDVLRMVLVALIAIPGMPLPVMLALLFTVAMVTPAERAARSAMLPQILEGDRYVLAIAVQGMTRQIAQLSGYFVGGVLATVNAGLALLLDSGTFALSALLIWIFVASRPAEGATNVRRNLFRETGEGIKLVFSHRVLRSIALLVFLLVGFAIIPEAAAPAWAAELRGDGYMQGAIMAAAPIGSAIGSLVIGRFMKPSTRLKVIRPIAMVTPLILIPAMFEPSLPVVMVMTALVNLAGGILMALNGLFVQTLPGNFRARAFGVMQTGVMLTQGAAVLGVGALANTSLSMTDSVGMWGIAGVILVSLLVLTWPSARTIEEATVAAKPPAPREPAEPPKEEAKPKPAPLGRPDAAAKADA
ncbi:MFS transporter [Phytomonospora sp. NPDC050363]|uniref:MFS transporter n=1 Tax=Phytomonospora sp. NPDC050363 TaxID=3155642 RepID=UPI003405A030